MKIIVAGYGFVGKAVTIALDYTHELVIVDPKFSDTRIQDHPDADGVIICVPTPGNTCDVSAIYDVMHTVPVFTPVLIKSTILPGKIEQLVKDFPKHAIAYSPEFLRAASSNVDFMSQEYMLISGDLQIFWSELFMSTLPLCTESHGCSNVEASLTKYAVNSFLALKVAFFNQLFDLCEKNGADFETVRQLVTKDQRIGESHSMVPGHDGQRGFGGACLPKDSASFTNYATEVGAPLTTVTAAVEYNRQLRDDLP